MDSKLPNQCKVEPIDNDLQTSCKEKIKYIYSIDPYSNLNQYDIFIVNSIIDFLNQQHSKTMKIYLAADNKYSIKYDMEILNYYMSLLLNYFNSERQKEAVPELKELYIKKTRLLNILTHLRNKEYLAWIESDNKLTEHHSASGFKNELECYSRPFGFSFDRTTTIKDHPITSDEAIYLKNFFKNDNLDNIPMYSLWIALKNLLTN